VCSTPEARASTIRWTTTPPPRDPAAAPGSTPTTILRVVEVAHRPVEVHQVREQVEEHPDLRHDVAEVARALLVVACVEPEAVPRHVELELAQHALDRGEGEVRMLVELVLAHREELQVDHAAAERRREIDPDERRVIAVADVDLLLVPVAQDGDPRDLAPVEKLPPQRRGEERDDEREPRRADRGGRLELEVPDDLLAAEHVPLAGDEQVHRAVRRALGTEQAECEPEPLLVQVAFQPVDGGDVIEPARILEHLYAPDSLPRERADRPVAREIRLDEHAQALVEVGDPPCVLARRAEERREVVDDALHEPEDAARLRLVEGGDGEELVEELGVRQVVAAEPPHHLVGATRGLRAGRPTVSDDHVAAPGRLRPCIGEEPRVRWRDDERQAAAGAHPDARLGGEPASEARPAQTAHHLAQERGAERRFRPPEAVEEGGCASRRRRDGHEVAVRRAAVLEVGNERRRHRGAEPLRDDGGIRPPSLRVEDARRQAAKPQRRPTAEQVCGSIVRALRRARSRRQPLHELAYRLERRAARARSRRARRPGS
jgi:hypothetical protein